MTEYTESVSGFKMEGDWKDVVVHGEKVACALREIGKTEEKFEDEFDEYNDWRPKQDEDMDEISEKTSEKASIEENKTEKESDSPKKEVQKAGKQISEGTKELDNSPDEAVGEFSASVVYLVRAITVFARKSVRHSEEVVFENLMTVLSPYYFDNELVSANIKGTSEDKYVLEINVNDDNLKDKVSEKLETYEDIEWPVAEAKDDQVEELVERLENMNEI